MRRSEQPVDNLSGGIGRAIAQKGVYIFGIGGQTGQIKRGAPDPCAPVGCRRRREPFAFETRQHERVDRDCQALFFTPGTGDYATAGTPRKPSARSDQILRSALAGSTVACSPGQIAPPPTHSRKTSISSSFNFPDGGILSRA